MLALAVFFTEHFAYDTFMLLNNLQYPKLANFIFTLQSASWIYLYIILSFIFPELHTFETVMSFWLGGGVVALVLTTFLSRKWPWKQTFAKKLELPWYAEKLKSASKIYITDIVVTINYYMDRYIVTAFLSLEMTGVYVFFSQVVTATWNLVASGVLAVYRPRLIMAYDSKNMAPFNKLFRSTLVRTLFTALILAIMAGVTVPLIVQFTDNETLLDYVPLLWLMLGAFMIKVCETSASTGLFAMHKDQDNFILAVIGFVMTGIVGSIGVMTLGVYGIVLNTVIVALASVTYARTVWRRPPDSAQRESMHEGNDNQKEPGHSIIPSHPVPSPLPAAANSNSSKKILIIASAFYPHVFGGGEIAAYNKAKLLVRRGYDVSVVTLREKDADPAWGTRMPEGYRLYRIKSPRQYTVFERSNQKSPLGKIFWHLQDYFDRRNQRLFNKVLDHVQPDHVQIDNLIGIGFNTLAEMGKRDIPVAFILHGLDFACFRTTMFRNGQSCTKQCTPCRPVAMLRQNPLDQIPRLGFIAPSRSALERARPYVPAIERAVSRVIRNVPDDIPALPERKSAEHIRLLYVGRLHPIKGIAFLLETLDGLSEEYNFHLNILGTGPSEEELKEKFGDKGWVTFRGFVSGEEVIHSIVQSDLSCMPTLGEEIYGIVTAQSLQLGTPVIGSDCGGTSELIRNNVTGKLVPPGDEAAWRDALTNIFENRRLLEEWHLNALRHAEEFYGEVIGQAYDEFIEALAAKPAQTLRAAA